MVTLQVAGMPISRAPGTVISYHCVNDVLKDRLDDGSRTLEVSCLEPRASGDQPQWEQPLVYPCLRESFFSGSPVAVSTISVLSPVDDSGSYLSNSLTE